MDICLDLSLKSTYIFIMRVPSKILSFCDRSAPWQKIIYFANVEINHEFYSTKTGTKYTKTTENEYDGETFEPKTLVYVDTHETVALSRRAVTPYQIQKVDKIILPVIKRVASAETVEKILSAQKMSND